MDQEQFQMREDGERSWMDREYCGILDMKRNCWRLRERQKEVIEKD